MTRILRSLRTWFLARFRLDERAVCEASAGLPPDADYHDYADSEAGVPTHFETLTCKRCGKSFTT